MEAVKEDIELTEEELYDAEYEKAWDDDGSATEDSLEQPEAENDSDVDEPEENEVIEDSKEANSKADIDEENQSESDAEEDSKSSKDFVEVLKWKGKEIPVTREELIALGQKGFDSEKKWQEAAINRPVKEILDKYGFTPEQLEMFGNITRDKNAEALALLAQQNGIDMFEAEHKNYKPVVEQKNYELDDVIAEINENEEIATQMNDYVSSVPQSVKDRLIKEPTLLRGLNIDMQKGIAQKVMPEVIKQLAINPNQDFVKVYQDVGHKVFSQEQPKADAEAQLKPEVSREDKKKVAVNKKAPAPEKNVADDYDAAWDDNAHFEAVRRRLQGF